jgi:predicted hydrocarbon binding protein
MSAPLEFDPARMLALPHAALHAVRGALLRVDGGETRLRDAGHSAGLVLYDAFAEWTEARALGAAEELPVTDFADSVAEFFRESGWGTVLVTTTDDGLVALECPAWAEVRAEDAFGFPACHFGTGLFAAFFGRVAERRLAVLETECRSAGAARCRFLVGSPEMLDDVYRQLRR